MPFVDIKVIEGAFSAEEKRQLVGASQKAVIAVEGEGLRPFTHTVITETVSGERAIGGQALTAEDVHASAPQPSDRGHPRSGPSRSTGGKRNRNLGRPRPPGLACLRGPRRLASGIRGANFEEEDWDGWCSEAGLRLTGRDADPCKDAS